MATIATDAPTPLAGQVGRAVLHRMSMPEHVRPTGITALDLLKRHGVAVGDRPLRTRAETEAFEAGCGVATTPGTPRTET